MNEFAQQDGAEMAGGVADVDDGNINEREVRPDKPSKSRNERQVSQTDDTGADVPPPMALKSKTPPSIAHSPSNGALPESQPMTAVSSTSSSLPTLQSTNANDSAGPSPYGTRSRNRTGNPRPNYAEEKEPEMEYEWASAKKSQAALTRTGSPQTGDNEKLSASHRRRSIAGTSGPTTAKANGAGFAAPKDYLPGMSSFSVNADTGSGSQTQSKKRKAPGSNLTSAIATGSSSTSSSTRRSSHAIPSAGTPKESNMFTFETSQGYLKHGKLVADDGTRFSLNDHVYLVCEPPGEPYYLARIMEFLHVDNNHSLPIESLRINWVYRPRDIARKSNDTRLVYVTMHSDTCPLTSLRGKSHVLHRSQIASMDEYRKQKDSFWFSQMFERYMHRYYDVIPTSEVINVPERVKKVLDERWKYVIVEVGRGKELTSAIKTCKRCVLYCASNDSVDCAMCKNTYHMNCVRPPLLKKPARGFAWSCGPCSRKQEKKLEARNTPLVGERGNEGEEEEFLDEEEDDHGQISNPTGGSSPDASVNDSGPRPATTEQLAQAKLWPYRYLGIHCKVEDALDYDDRIYPRASSRLGPRHQANVIVWHGRPLELIKPAEIKRKYVKGSSHKKDAKLSRETVAALEAEKMAREKRPKWVIDEPPGFIRRGDDRPNEDPANTAKMCFTLPEVGERSSRGLDDSHSNRAIHEREERERIVDEYMIKARELAPSLGLPPYSTNFLDAALRFLYTRDFAAEEALKQLRTLDPRKDLKEPRLNKEELKRFEEGVTRYGTNLHEVSRHVGKSQKHGEIVRFYYIWKKTDRGKQIWGNFDGRKSKKQAKQLDSSLVDDVADDVDDSAFDNDKAAIRKRGFECKFCSTRHSRYWRRAPGTAPGTSVLADPGTKMSKDKTIHLMVALCQRCSGLWRKYAIQWENIDEVAKKVAQAGGRAWKRKMDEELLIELINANEASSVGMSTTAVAAAASVGIDVPPALTIHPEQEAARKKMKAGVEKETTQQMTTSSPAEPPKKKVIEKLPEPPLIPEQPKQKTLPCVICNEMEPTGDEHFSCRHCRLTVHRNCYGIPEGRSPSKWICDLCSNDMTSQASTSYDCVLCPVQYNEYELWEPPKTSHKKKTDREREKERLEKELVAEATVQYRRRQDELGRPPYPREPLKRTTGNNWIHVVCAVWTPWIKFSSPKLLEVAEGLNTIPAAKYEQVCKLCKMNTGVCVNCHKCAATFHVTCAQQNGFPMGFDVTPVKSSRRDFVNTVELGSEAGNVEAVIYCREHAVKAILHPVSETIENSGCNALQLFVRNFKQADESLTGTVRKAAIINSSTRMISQATNLSNGHRGSISTGATNGVVASATALTTRSSRVSPAAVTVKSEEVDDEGDRIVYLNELVTVEPSPKKCASCAIEASPKWHKMKVQSDLESLRADPHRNPPEPTLQQSPTGVNGHTEGLPGNHQETPSTGLNRPQEVTASGNGVIVDLEPLDREDVVIALAQPNTAPTQPIESREDYLCHRCFLKKPIEPSPDPVTVQSAESLPRVSQENPQVEVPIPSPSVWAPAAVIHPRREPWPGQPLPQPVGQVPLVNGTMHSPRHMMPHVHPPYAGPPQQYFTNGYENREQHRGLSAQHPSMAGPYTNAPGPNLNGQHTNAPHPYPNVPGPHLSAVGPPLPYQGIPHPSAPMPHPNGPVSHPNGPPHPNAPIQHPTVTMPHPSASVQHPSPPIQHPNTPVQRPGAAGQHPNASRAPLNGPSQHRETAVLNQGAPVPHQSPTAPREVNNAPASYQISRNGTGPPEQAPRSRHGPGPHSAQHSPPTTNGTRSPPVHYRTAAHGPPPDSDNPFYEARYDRPMSSRHHYHRPRRMDDERPETPTGAEGRHGGGRNGDVRNGNRPGHDEGNVNGASASPNLRNLLH